MESPSSSVPSTSSLVSGTPSWNSSRRRGTLVLLFCPNSREQSLRYSTSFHMQLAHRSRSGSVAGYHPDVLSTDYVTKVIRSIHPCTCNMHVYTDVFLSGHTDVTASVTSHLIKWPSRRTSRPGPGQVPARSRPFSFTLSPPIIDDIPQRPCSVLRDLC